MECGGGIRQFKGDKEPLFCGEFPGFINLGWASHPQPAGASNIRKIGFGNFHYHQMILPGSFRSVMRKFAVAFFRLFTQLLPEVPPGRQGRLFVGESSAVSGRFPHRSLLLKFLMRKRGVGGFARSPHSPA
jgi:hypothetical protein